MIKALLNLFKREKSFLETNEFRERVDAIVWDRLGNAPTIWGISVLMYTAQDAENWLVKNQSPITEEDYMKILNHHIDNCMDRPLPAQYIYRTLREAETASYGAKK